MKVSNLIKYSILILVSFVLCGQLYAGDEDNEKSIQYEQPRSEWKAHTVTECPWNPVKEYKPHISCGLNDAARPKRGVYVCGLKQKWGGGCEKHCRFIECMGT